MLSLSLILPMLFALSGYASDRPFHVDRGFFKDQEGAVVLFRGVNIAEKTPPFNSLKPSDLAPLPSWGVNLIRLGFNWEAFEPSRGEFNTEYLRWYEAIVTEARKLGIYVVVDFHQDGFSRFTTKGCGEGFPLWTVTPKFIPDVPDNTEGCSHWITLVYENKKGKDSWRRFYLNETGIRDRFILVWKILVERLKRHPNVIAYDLLNEPWGDELTEIAPLYRSLLSELRQIDENGVFLLEPFFGFGQLPSTLDFSREKNVVFAPHYYDLVTIINNVFNGDPSPIRNAFTLMQSKARTWNSPLFLGEFGMFPGVSGVEKYMDYVYEFLDSGFSSSTQWAYHPRWNPVKKDGWNGENFSTVDDGLSFRANYRLRPYARRVSGIPILMRSDEKSSVFRWKNAPRTGKTEIFLPGQPKFHLNSHHAKCHFKANAILQCSSSRAEEITLQAELHRLPRPN